MLQFRDEEKIKGIDDHCPLCKGMVQLIDFDYDPSSLDLYAKRYKATIKYKCTQCGNEFAAVILRNFGEKGWYAIYKERCERSI